MGTKVLATGEPQQKPDFAVSTVAAAVFTLGAGEMAIFVGTTSGYKGEQVNFLNTAYDKLREVSNPATATFNTAVVENNVATLTLDAAIPVLTEDQVAVIYSGTFKAGGMSRTAFTKRLIEKYLETTQKAA